MSVGLKAPENILPVAGVQLATVASNMRYTERDDVLLMVFPEQAKTAAVFTKNRYCAAPVTVAKQHLQTHQPRALLVNAGNANAGTGQQGEVDALACCELLAEKINCATEQVLPFSTGVIGQPLPMSQFALGIEEAASQVLIASSDWYAAASAIMTTDTLPKAHSEQCQIDGETVTVTGIAKGSGMICPDMATMLSYIVTDAKVDEAVLQLLLNQAVEASFNRITVDGDTSTNDALTLTATAQVGKEFIAEATSDEAKVLGAVIQRVATRLAQAVVRDGEGATKFVEINVAGGVSEADCMAVAYTVAHSPLVKTALFASDPNWGRILAAVGRAPVSQLDIAAIDIAVNGVSIIQAGEPADDYTEERGQAAFSQEDIVMNIALGDGDSRYNVWTSDLSHDYVTINAEYRS